MNDDNTTAYLPQDLDRALLVGRVWREDVPALVAVRQGEVIDISTQCDCMADLLDRGDAADFARSVEGESLGSVTALLQNSLAEPQVAPYLLAPCDVQAIKACGVTFAVSLLERVIEEQAGGDAAKASQLRAELKEMIGQDLSRIAPGSDEAMALKTALQARGAWSQYMEVGLGPDAEVFTKAQPFSSVGFGARVGLHPASKWNNPEPEIVLAVDARGEAKGATLGNDVNLRDIEGRSALLLGKAKDNNASCAIGPFIRLFDEGYTLDDVRKAELTMTVTGEDGFVLNGASSMSQISRDPASIVAQTIGRHHQYPDGFLLFLGTLFAPTEDRDAPGQGFTHHVGDVVSISEPALGALQNTVRLSTEAPEWTFGTGALMRNLARRNLL